MLANHPRETRGVHSFVDGIGTWNLCVENKFPNMQKLPKLSSFRIIPVIHNVLARTCRDQEKNSAVQPGLRIGLRALYQG